MSRQKLLILSVLLVLFGGFIFFDIGHYLSLEYFQAQKNHFFEYQQNNPVQSAAIYFSVYVVITALSLPAAAVVTLIGGALFGLLYGTILVSFASTLGATLAFLLARTLFRDSVQKRFSSSLKKINQGIAREGDFYLFGLRLVPVFPFFAVNLLMGLTHMPATRFFIVSQIGMLPGTIVYVNAGTQIAQLESLSGIASPGLLLSFALLGLLPLVSKRVLDGLRAKRVYANVDRPEEFDTNMVVIGAGSGGLVSAYIAAATKAKVTLIEKNKMGGDCLNTGCVPSKAIIRSASAADQVRSAGHFGVKASLDQVDFTRVMQRVHEVIKKIEPHDSVERYTELGVDCVQGEARILDPFRVQVNGRTIATRNIVVATGAHPATPRIDGIDGCPHYNSDTIWSLKDQPRKLLVIGSGPIGCELAQSFRRLGSEVCMVNRSDRILAKEDPEVSQVVRDQFIQEGISLYLGANIHQIYYCKTRNSHVLELDYQNEAHTIEFDCLLTATGRTPNTIGFGLEDLGVELNDNGTIKVNEYLQTNYPNIYACGDVSGPYQLTHAASHQAWYVAVNALFGRFKKFIVDYRVIPWSTFTDPEVARVGLSETEAKAEGVEYEVTRYDLDDLDRAIADSHDSGFVKVLTAKGSDKIIGACIVGKHAGDLLAEFVLAMKHGLGLNKILGTIHSYPTMMEANKYLAGEWKRNHTPDLAMKLLPRFHAWMRNR